MVVSSEAVEVTGWQTAVGAQVFRQKAIYLSVPCFNRWIERPVGPE